MLQTLIPEDDVKLIEAVAERQHNEVLQWLSTVRAVIQRCMDLEMLKAMRERYIKQSDHFSCVSLPRCDVYHFSLKILIDGYVREQRSAIRSLTRQEVA